jgi:hypothetical protein
MLRRSLPTALALCALGMSALPLSASGTSRASTAAQQTARDALAKFDKGEPGWRVRMTALVDLVKAGPDAVPVLVEALQNGTPTARAFAAQALVFIADSRARPALEKAVGDQDKTGAYLCPECSEHVRPV